MSNQKHCRPFIRKLPEMSKDSYSRSFVQPRRWLVGNHKPWLFRYCRGDQYPPGHAPGQFKGIQFFRLRPQSITRKSLPVPRLCLRILLSLKELRPHLHKRVQPGHALGNQCDFSPPKLFRPFFIKRSSVIKDLSLHLTVIGQDSKDPVSQQALSRATLAYHGRHLPRKDLQRQIPDRLNLALLRPFFILCKRNG